MMWTHSFVILAAWAMLSLNARAVEVNPLYSENTAYKIVAKPFRMDHQLRLGANPLGGGSQSVGYRFAFSLGSTAVDLGVNYLKATWGSLSPHPSAGEEALQTTAPNGRERLNSDPWTLLFYELGYSIRGRIYPLQAKDWIQFGRISIGYGKVTEVPISRSVSTLLYGMEAGVTNVFSNEWGLSPSVVYHFGRVDHTPLSSLQFVLSLNYFPR